MSETMSFLQGLYQNDSDEQLQKIIESLRTDRDETDVWRQVRQRFLDAALQEQEDRVNRQLLEWSTKGGREVLQQSVVG